MSPRDSRRWIAVLGALVPRDRREEWKEEWAAEFAALRDARSRGEPGLPSSLGFAMGALTHAIWMRTEGWTMDSLWHDVRYSIRGLMRTPVFTGVAALTLALGVGANALIFSLINGLVWRSPAEVHEPARLVQIARSYSDAPRWDVFSYPAMKMIEAESPTMEGVAGYSNEAFTIGSGRDTDRVVGQLVTGNYFGVLGVRPQIGRLIEPADDVQPGAHPVVVMSHALWANRYGADPDVVGTTVLLGSQSYEVIGVTPRGFVGLENLGTPPTLFVPMAMHPPQFGSLPFEEWGSSSFAVVGRMRDGTTFEQAVASMEGVNAQLRAAAAVNENIEVLLAESVGLSPGEREAAQQISLILVAIVALVLLLTCTNVANLFMSRATSRQGEVGVRLALGAGRDRVARQFLTEATSVAVLATLLSVPLVMLAGTILPWVFPFTLAVTLEPDSRVYGFLAVVGLGAGLLFGVAPAWAASRRDVAATLRDGASTSGPSRTRLRDGLVVAQLALSLALVSGAALLGKSVLNAQRAEPGFDPRGLSAAIVDLETTGRYDEESGLAFYEQLLSETSALPGVRAATLANQLPIAGGHSRRSASRAGQPDDWVEAEYISVGPAYFETMGIPVRGRPLLGFTDEPEPVVVVNESLARRFWPDQDPVGQYLEGDPQPRVVGVVPDVQMRSLRSPGNPSVYHPLAHSYEGFVALTVSMDGAPMTADAFRDVVATVDPALPVATVIDLHAAMSDSMAETQTIGILVGVFAALALVLAAVGLYGLVSFGVSQRIREIGIRIALGARPDSLRRLVLRRGLGIALVGVFLGLWISFALARALESLLFGVGATDPMSLIAASLVLLAAAGTAAWIPAHRASRVDAATSLRD